MEIQMFFRMLLLAAVIISFYSASMAASAPDSSCSVYYDNPEEPLQPNKKPRGDCLDDWVLSEVRCFTALSGCGWAKVETACNWGTPDVYCCKTQQDIDRTWEISNQRAYQKAKSTCGNLIHQCRTVK